LRLKVLLHELSKIYKNAEKFYEDYADFLDLAEEGVYNHKIPWKNTARKVLRKKCSKGLRMCLRSG